MRDLFNNYLFNNKRVLVSSILLAIAVLTFIIVLLGLLVFQWRISPLLLFLPLIGIVGVGGYLSQLRSGPPW